jgi:hypothetical protein
MPPLNQKYVGILWINVAILSLGVGFLVYKKFDNVIYGAGAGFVIGLLEYVFMRMSLGRKQQREDEREKNRK